MTSPPWTLLSGLISALVAAMVPGPTLQIPGYCEITSPAEGEAVGGIVSVVGSAYHPSFAQYDLWFSYVDDITGTWFPLSEDLSTPVRQGRLGLWDTTSISDGDYTLRLRVWLTDGSAFTAIVKGVQVRNAVPQPLQLGTIPFEAEPVAPSPAPSPAPVVEERIVQKQHVEPAGVTEALLAGGAAGAAALGLLAGYVGLRDCPRLSGVRRRGRRQAASSVQGRKQDP